VSHDLDEPLNTNSLQLWVVELQAGRPNAAEGVFRGIQKSVQRLAARAFKKFPRAGRFADLDDVIQGSMIRLLSTLRAIRPESTRQFYALANTAIRRELLDLIKKYYGPAGAGTNLSGISVGNESGELDPAEEYRSDLDSMTAFHSAVEHLPTEERESFSLKYYHDWPLTDIADLFGVSVRTVQRWQGNAEHLLRQKLGEI
jgi:RNA polymerase sigma-70 factor (ECF subfamily)